jgi:hypothetical protein
MLYIIRRNEAREMAAFTISLDDAKYLDLFDDIPYKYLKDCYANNDADKNDEELDIEIIDLPCDRIAYAKIKIIFEIRFVYDIRFGETNYKTLKYEKMIEYNTSSGVALKLMEIMENDDEE